MSAPKDDNTTFGWDWFNVDGPGRATKIQEAGKIAFKQKKTANGWEITKMEFLTDVSCRQIILMKERDPRKPHWRVNILKGSTITWPSLINGRVVPN